MSLATSSSMLFQLTAARRRLGAAADIGHLIFFVSTHSRPKAAGESKIKCWLGYAVSTHSRPKAAGASAETLNRQGLHCPVSLRFH